MQISCQQYSHMGKRENNEDCIISDLSKGVFVVCDGVGGRNKGEVASYLTCYTIIDFFKKSVITVDTIQQAIDRVEGELLKYVRENPASEGLATTMVFMALRNNTAFVAHIGDSRVYQIRDGEIIFQTKDHSLVNELLASGYITEDEARNHPKRNVITRAIQANQSGLSTEADVHFIDSIMEQDYFLMCTDGVTEVIDNKWIKQFFVAGNSVDFLLDNIKKECFSGSNDNNSAVVIKIIDFK